MTLERKKGKIRKNALAGAGRRTMTDKTILENAPSDSGAMTALRRVTWLGMILNFGLSGLKFAAGFLGHSSVLVADAVHSFSDLATDVAVLVGSRYWDRPADSDHPNGHAKIETLVTLFIGAALLLVGFGLIRGAVETLGALISGEGDRTAPNLFALVAALVSVVIKEWLYRVTVRVGRRVKSEAVIANAWHHRSDAMSSIPAALAVGACLLFGPRYVFLDPVGTVVVSCMILYAAFGIMRPAVATLLDRGETNEKIALICSAVTENAEVRGVHKIRTRPLGGGRLAVDLHIQVDPEMTVRIAHHLAHHIANDIRERIPDIVDVVAHVEPN